MRPNRTGASNTFAALKDAIALGAALVVILTLAPAGLAQTGDSKPEELGKQRTALYLRATRAPLADMETDINRIAVVSENCRMEHGSTACGLPDKALESDKLEDRYTYYVKGPVEAHAKSHGAKIDRRNWAVSNAPGQR